MVKADKEHPSPEVLSAFFDDPGLLAFRPVQSGHINRTFRVKKGAAGPEYVLRKINTSVFRDPEQLLENLLKVTSHLRKKRINTITPVPALNGKWFVKTRKNEYWHLMKYISKSKVYENVPDRETALNAGKAFGSFIFALSDLPPAEIGETIPDFHNLGLRLKTFKNIVKANPLNRVEKCTRELRVAGEWETKLQQFSGQISEGKIPLRITHNDTKIGNVLFDEEGKAATVIDLDTVMPGIIHYDFGDSIRTFACTAPEDVSDLSEVNFDAGYFKAYTGGFISALGKTLTQNERETLHMGPYYMTFIMGIRFLTDYLNGDVYYKTNYPEHNLQRAKVQFRFLHQLEKNGDYIRKTIRSI